MTAWLLVCVGGPIGAVARWVLDGAVQRRWPVGFPIGILAINVLGSFLLGALLAGTRSSGLHDEWVALAGTGFCGGFTTFSTFAFETSQLMHRHELLAAGANLLLSNVLGIVLVFAGLALGRLV